MTPSRIVVASQNADKIREVEALVALHIPKVECVLGLTWPDIDETEPTLEGNALLKARSVAAYTGLPALADDTGLEVDELDGGPGVRTARFAGERATYGENVSLLLTMLEGLTDRRASFRTVAALVIPGGAESVAEGTLVGRIATTPRGAGGFGYDAVFEASGRTLAELGDEEKNRMSHRARALKALIASVWGP